ncbi:MAG: DUF5681 domain-containing protein [Pseudomonadota bacterium]
MSERKANLPAVLPGARNYEVGYGKPPVSTRFKKGQSGNPKGRPKGSKNKVGTFGTEHLQAVILDEAYRDVTVRDGERNITVPMAQAVVRAIAVNAAKGRHGSQKLFTALVSATERRRRAQHEDWIETWTTYKRRWEEELARRERLGIDAPDPLPHPDHVVVDARNDTISIVGPVTKEEKAKYDHLLKTRDIFAKEAEELRKVIARVKRKDWKEGHQEELEKTEKALEIIDMMLKHGGWWALPDPP